jgi:hypothetical protein
MPAARSTQEIDIISPMSVPHPSRARDRIDFDHEHKVMSMFSDNAKTYIQLSGAALALTLTFAQQILHIPKDKNIADFWMILMWSCFLLTVLAGAFYQYLAAKFLEQQINWEFFKLWGWVQGGIVYGVMLISFYGGAIIFTIYAISHLPHP